MPALKTKDCKAWFNVTIGTGLKEGIKIDGWRTNVYADTYCKAKQLILAFATDKDKALSDYGL